MAKNIHIEDIYTEFHDRLIGVCSIISSQDLVASTSFYNLITSGGKITEAQGRYMLKLLEKYKNLVIAEDFDYRNQLINPSWKHPFRVLDNTKKIYVETDKNGESWICLKHPFALKDKFNKEVVNSDKFENGIWDNEERVRKFSLY